MSRKQKDRNKVASNIFWNYLNFLYQFLNSTNFGLKYYKVPLNDNNTNLVWIYFIYIFRFIFDSINIIYGDKKYPFLMLLSLSQFLHYKSYIYKKDQWYKTNKKSAWLEWFIYMYKTFSYENKCPKISKKYFEFPLCCYKYIPVLP